VEELAILQTELEFNKNQSQEDIYRLKSLLHGI